MQYAEATPAKDTYAQMRGIGNADVVGIVPGLKQACQMVHEATAAVMRVHRVLYGEPPPMPALGGNGHGRTSAQRDENSVEWLVSECLAAGAQLNEQAQSLAKRIEPGN